MNNPFELFQNKDAQTEQEGSRLRLRVGVLLGLFCALMLTYVGILFSVQVINSDQYLPRDIPYVSVSTETVETVRGEITDRNGNVLVTNTLSYQVFLDLGRMDGEHVRIVTDLLALCREEGVVWSDSFPVSRSAPWQYTKQNVFSYPSTDSDGNATLNPTLLGALSKRMKWVNDPTKATLTAEELLTSMCLTFGLIEDESEPITAEMRAVVGVLYELFLRAYEITYNEYVFASGVDMTFITRVKEHDLPGVLVKSTTARSYTTDSAAHILGPVAAISPDDWPTYKELGYAMDDYVGKGGVELAFESWLHGSDGTRRIEADADGNILSETWSVEPQPGSNVVLTIDANLQATTEDLLANFVTTLEEPRGAAAVMIDVNDGSILALASYPTYDLSTYFQNYNDLLADPGKPLYNRVTHGLYAPGSTYKPLVAVAALSEGIITPTSTVYCDGVYTHYPDYQPVCWIYTRVGGRHREENVSKAITDSCNIFFYDVGRRLGIDTIVDYAAMFGLGEKTGIETGENQGRVAGPDTSAALGLQWYGGLTLAASIGQENNQFTPIQLANYVATLVNGGNHYEVHLLKEVKSSDYSRTVYTYEPVLKNTIDINPTALAAVKKGMYDLSKTAAMAPYFADLPFEVGCKTGTAEVAGADANSVFVCFAPYDNPQVAICIVVEGGAAGEGSLASIAAGMLSQFFVIEPAQTTPTVENTLIP